MLNRIYLSLGSNSGNRLKNIEHALELINETIGTIIARSDIFETQSWGYKDADYLNCVVEIQSESDIVNILNKTQEIEKQSGRTSKTEHINKTPIYKARPIDIDILFYNSDIINSENLIIPHPLLHERKFVLLPLVQIAPEFLHPIFKKNIPELLSLCTDISIISVKKTNTNKKGL